MLWVVGITLALMVIFAFIAAAGEHDRDPVKLTIGQAILEYGWIVLAACGIIALARGCG